MLFVRSWSDPERWQWFAAGDPEAAPKIESTPPAKNSPRRVLFETGLALLIPLAFAALIEIILGMPK